MKKMILVFVVVLIAVLAIGKNSNKEMVGEILLDNVEALANGEYAGESCFGGGNVTCHTGEKVEFIIKNYSLE